MPRQLALVTLVVRDHDEAIRFYVDAVGFELREDSDLATASAGSSSDRRASGRRLHAA